MLTWQSGNLDAVKVVCMEVAHQTIEAIWEGYEDIVELGRIFHCRHSLRLVGWQTGCSCWSISLR